MSKALSDKSRLWQRQTEPTERGENNAEHQRQAKTPTAYDQFPLDVILLDICLTDIKPLKLPMTNPLFGEQCLTDRDSRPVSKHARSDVHGPQLLEQ
jgi:hypothetical protein